MNYPATNQRLPAWKPLALVSILSSLGLAPALAQTAPSAAAAATSSVLITATRVAQPIGEVLSDHVVISAEEIALSGHSSLAELLQKKRGIEITANGGTGAYASVLLRGADNKQSIVLVDGVRIGAATTGGATWSAIPLSQIDHIEIVYGALSSLYGADAMGGVIQLFTKQGGGKPTPTASLGFGTYGARTLEAAISGSSDGDKAFKYAISVAHDEADGFSSSKPGAGVYTYNPDKDGYKKDSASGQLAFAFAKGHEIGASFLQSRQNTRFDAGPGYDDRSIEKLENFSVHSKNQFLPAWQSLVQLSRSADKNATDASYGQGDFDTTHTDLTWQNDIAIGSDRLQVVLQHHKEKVDAVVSELIRERNTNSVALAYQLKRGAHLASASIRNDNSSVSGSNATGSLGYGYFFSPALRANASFGTSFRAPAFNELYYPGFGLAGNRAERGKNAEIGLQYDDRRSQLSATYFRNRVSDLLVYVPTCPVEQSTHEYGCAYNVNKALLTGLSLGAASGFGPYTVRASVDLQDPRDETADKRLARRARQHASIALEYHAGAIKAGVETLMSGSRFDDAANLNRLGGYGLLNLYGSYALGANWSLFGRWNNALNKEYELAKNFATAGSNLFVGIRYGL